MRHYGAAKQYTKCRSAIKRAPSPDGLNPISREEYYGAIPQSFHSMSSDPTFQTEDEIYHVYNKKGSKSRAKRTTYQHYQPPVLMLGADDLERVAYYLDSKSAVSLLLTCKAINENLTGCSGFWRQLCKNENFHEYSALKREDGPTTSNGGIEYPNAGNNDVVGSDIELEPLKTMKRKKRVTFKDMVMRSRCANKRNEGQNHLDRMTWSGEKFHDINMPENATLWRKIYLRGIQMRRNIVEGRFELWRLFLTDENHLPVKKMTSTTTFRELRYFFVYNTSKQAGVKLLLDIFVL